MKKTVITIARSYGSGGKTLGNLLAKDLGINCYSREILRMASDESGINEALFGEVDEKMKKSPLLFNILKKNPYKGGVLPPESSDFVSGQCCFSTIYVSHNSNCNFFHVLIPRFIFHIIICAIFLYDSYLLFYISVFSDIFL